MTKRVEFLNANGIIRLKSKIVEVTNDGKNFTLLPGDTLKFYLYPPESLIDKLIQLFTSKPQEFEIDIEQ